MFDIGPGEVIAEDLVNDDRDAFKDIASVDPLVIVGRGGGNGEIVATVPVELRIR